MKKNILITLVFALLVFTGHAQNTSTKPSDIDLVELSSSELVAKFDRSTGLLYSIQRKNDKLETFFIGDQSSNSMNSDNSGRLTGNLTSMVWDQTYFGPAGLDYGERFQRSGEWQPEMTANSGDIRKVSVDSNTIKVDYTGKSENDGGIRSYNLSMQFELTDDEALLWTFSVTNILDHPLEIGELGIPLQVNDNYRSLYENITPDEAHAQNLTSIKQTLIHQQRVFAHHYAGGHSSYTIIQRPMGDENLLLIHPVGNTAFESVYGNALELYSTVMNSNMGRMGMGMGMGMRTDWVNGNTSLMLEPGETRTFSLRFKFIKDYPEIREELYQAGNLGVRVLPSMVAQENTPVYVDVKTREPITEIKALSDGITVTNRKSVTGRDLLTFSFSGQGQKTVRLKYGNGKWTTLLFYCTNDVASMLKARGRFIAERQFLEDPDDPYHRNHMFLPFDHEIGSTYREATDVWEVGGSDEFGFSEPLFLAEKNVYYPSREEVEKLEMYVDDCLFKYIQDPETYKVACSIYWVDRTPSDPWGQWTKERAAVTWRTYNYPHVANIYHALYRIGKNYGLLTSRTPSEYLRMSYRTCMTWFETGYWTHVGLMLGSNAVNILEDLRKEGWDEEYKSLLTKMEECNNVFAKDPYPYSSELVIDQTAHEQVYFFTKYFGSKEKQLQTLKVIQAMRGGNQPFWFLHGNDKRGNMACWYTASTNGMALLDGYEETGDEDMLLKGYAGVMCVSANLREDGMGHAWFFTSPGRLGWDSRTLDNGIGQYAFFKSAKSYVVKDESFGLVGYGCTVEQSGSKIKITPHDGLSKRLMLVDEKIDIELGKGEIAYVTYDTESGLLELSITDSSGFVDNAEIEINGLQAGNYYVKSDAAKSFSLTAGKPLSLSIPIKKAASIEVIKGI
ncbi:MAG: DUF5695 domain-containing protein [Mangrovibacterium sp.]